ncbi:hypothetical protein KEU06_06450 [Pseudaminobacter sp. 19-2017]|uniref:Uncharacterized protein n=1 Tax=Pseudaminobacter soli (ex Zhang et al. 2022) TaxID=2831468 RepID=A0A942DZY7_9HYPH|nr:hypothetical protein [Pseudaminobacter soli]MBS3648265.1 hypothetical protein [Pseudaminobacter soli]
MSALGDIMAGLRTVMELTGKVETLTGKLDRLAMDLNEVDRRLVRVETIIEVTRSDGATLRIARDPENKA